MTVPVASRPSKRPSIVLERPSLRKEVRPTPQGLGEFAGVNPPPRRGVRSPTPTHISVKVSVQHRKGDVDRLMLCSVCMDRLGFYVVEFPFMKVRYCWKDFPSELRTYLRGLYLDGY